jgi:hypothetical protein
LSQVEIKHENSIPWRRIPPEVKEEADALAKYTGETGREGSITFCKKKDRSRLFVGNNFEGDFDSTEALNCDVRFGKSQRIGSMHSHPSNADTIGILPSEADLSSSVDDSYRSGKQIDCITSPDTPLVNCHSFNRKADKKDAQRYRRAAANSVKITDPFFVDNVSKDFDFALFDRESGIREDEPAPKKVIKAAFGKSNKELRKSLKVFERGAFCEYVADLMGQNREDVIEECRKELRKRSFLGLIDY